ncbi:plasmid pRiA4b ORF-3 family protein [Parasporobacterium paucivorans]|nr:plasmid pRiA4b ORF-3 family protein [Parasporobacterium paucivorans]
MIKKLENKKDGSVMKAYIVKIEMKGSEPLVWRRIIMPAGATYRRLHDIIQDVTNFRGGYPNENYHLYAFVLSKENIRVTNDEDAYEGHKHFLKNKRFYKERLETIPDNLEEFERAYQESLKVVIRKPSGLKIDGYLERQGEILYEYDFGAGWQLVVRLEETVEDYPYGYPMLLDGEGTAPPEDVGGLEGFYEFLRIYHDESHPQHESTKVWATKMNFREYNKEWINYLLKSIKYKKKKKGA